MKKNNFILKTHLLCLAISVSFACISFCQNIAINTTGAAAASTNMLEVLSTNTAVNTVGIYSGHSGAIIGTGYGLWATKTGASTTNVGGYFNASGATNNYALIVPSGGGRIGFGTTAPVAGLHLQGSEDVTQFLIRANATQSNTNPLIRIESSTGTDLLWLHSNSTSNTFLGLNSGRVTTGNLNTFAGSNAGYTNTTGFANTFVGHQAGYTNLGGTYNSFFGRNAGYTNSAGDYNSFFGHAAGYTNTASSNTFVGYEAGQFNSTGPINTFVGRSAGHENTLGSYNTFVGGYAGFSNLTTDYNAFFGYYAGYNNIASYNSFFGNEAGQLNTSGTSNTFLGRGAGHQNLIGNGNTFVGRSAGYNNTADDNTFVGEYAGYTNTNGAGNTCIGRGAGYTVSGLTSQNTMVGYNAGYNTTGFYNSFLGYRAGVANTSGYQNTIIGYQAGVANNTGFNNTLIGMGAGNGITTGNGNTVLGWAGTSIIGGTNNTILGYGADVGSSGLTNATAIGYFATVSTSNSLVLGSGVNVGIGTSSPNVKLDVEGGTDAEAITANSGYVIIGTPTSTHIAIDNNEIMAKATGTTTNTLFIQNDGGETIFGTGNVGLGRNPVTNDLEVEGTASKTTAGDWLANSDQRIKTNVKEIENALGIIKNIRPVKFQYTEDHKKQHPSIEDHYYYNIIAQEFMNVFPDFVKVDGEGLLMVDTYPAFIVAIAAVKEQQKLIEELQKKNEGFTNEINDLKKLILSNTSYSGK